MGKWAELRDSFRVFGDWAEKYSPLQARDARGRFAKGNAEGAHTSLSEAGKATAEQKAKRIAELDKVWEKAETKKKTKRKAGPADRDEYTESGTLITNENWVRRHWPKLSAMHNEEKKRIHERIGNVGKSGLHIEDEIVKIREIAKELGIENDIDVNEKRFRDFWGENPPKELILRNNKTTLLQHPALTPKYTKKERYAAWLKNTFGSGQKYGAGNLPHFEANR
jgi:hypothetical protein